VFISLISRQLEKYVTIKGCDGDSCFISLFHVWQGKREDAAKLSSSAFKLCIYLDLNNSVRLESNSLAA